MMIVTVNADRIISEKQAKYFAMQIYEPMKKYLTEHKAEYEEWVEKTTKKEK